MCVLCAQMYSLRSPINSVGCTKRRRFGADLNNKRTKAYQLHAEEVQNSLKEWEQELNSINTDPAPIFVENKVDHEGRPQVRRLPCLDGTVLTRSLPSNCPTHCGCEEIKVSAKIGVHPSGN